MEHNLFDELKALIWIFSRIGIHRKGEIDHVPLNATFIGGFMVREEALIYRSAILILAVNLYIVTVQRRQFLVSRPCWSPSHHRMQPISYRRIFCLEQCYHQLVAFHDHEITSRIHSTFSFRGSVGR